MQLRSFNDRHLPRGKPEPKVKGARVTRAKRKRMKEDAVYLAVIDEYKLTNPICAEPLCGEPSVQFHHIANGPDRRASLANTDLGICGCDLHASGWDAKGDYPIARQFAIKFLAILRRYKEITRKNVCVKDVIRYLEQPRTQE